MIRVNITNAPAQDVSLLIDGQIVQLGLRWQPSTTHWYLSVSVGETVLTSGRAVVAREPLVRDARLKGEIVCLPTANRQGDPGLNAWDGNPTHQLLMLTEAELV